MAPVIGEQMRMVKFVTGRTVYYQAWGLEEEIHTKMRWRFPGESERLG